ncbi:solute carrier family 2, facilitated glucose transporter member 5-like isoform 2-T3 [Vipera latastei]
MEIYAKGFPNCHSTFPGMFPPPFPDWLSLLLQDISLKRKDSCDSDTPQENSVPLDLHARMEEKEESEPTTRNNKLTRSLVFSIVGASLGVFQYGYTFSLITNPVVMKMQLLNLQNSMTHTDIEFLILFSVFVPLGGLFGVYLWGCLADRHGRKCALLVINGLSVVSSAILCFDQIFRQFEFSLFARFMAGMTSGTFIFSVPLYVLEISSLNLRGALVTSLILFFSWGYLLVQILSSPQIWGNEENFSLLVGVTSIFAVISIIVLALSPESPRFLYMQRNDEEQARQVLKMLRGEEDVEEEMEELCQEHLAESSQKNMTVWKLLRFRGLRWHLVTVLVLVSGSGLVDTNTVLIFAKQTYKDLGLSTRDMNLLLFVGSVIIQLTLLTTICTIESLGRRFLLLSGFLICSILTIALVITFQIYTSSLVFTSIVLILFFMAYVAGPACILPVIIGELFLQSSRVSAYVIAGFVTWGTNFISALLFLLTQLFIANLTKEEAMQLENFWFILSPAVILFPMGGFTGIVLFANLVDKYGRKFLLLFNNSLTFVASVFLCVSNSVHLLAFTLFANFMAGISSGIFSCCDPLYLLEVSPIPLRGSMTAASTLFFSLGLILGYMLGLPNIWGNKEDFPFMSILLGIFATISILLLLICPESPRFIFIQKKNETKATEVLRSLRAQGDVTKEIKDLQEEDFYELVAKEKKMTFWKFLCTQNFRWPIVTTIVLTAGSQLSGITGMFFYTKKVYAVMGLSKGISEVISLSLNIIIIISLVTSIHLIEMWGRRIPLIMGFMICSMSCILLTFALEFQV